jgi:ketosteroid isomerase-like protein
MRKLALTASFLFTAALLYAQRLPCSNPVYRQFDFWIGEWEAFGVTGTKAGDSKISVILDSCVILEEWTSAGLQQGLRYAGKSYNTYNNLTKQWQQTWVDNTGSCTEYLEGSYSNGKIAFISRRFKFSKDSFAIRRLSFYKIADDKVRQHGEISKDEGKTYSTEYDLEYRKKIADPVALVDTVLKKMEAAYNSGAFEKVAAYYADNGKIVGAGTEVIGKTNITAYWKGFSRMGGHWKLSTEKAEFTGNHIWHKGVSVIMDKNNKQHKVSFTLILIQQNGEWKILQDAYW